MEIRSAFLAVIAGALLYPGSAFADVTFDWTFAGPVASGSGTLTAIASGTPSLDYITGGSGTITYSTLKYAAGGTLAVTFGTCATPGEQCTFTDTDGTIPGSGANLTIDNWLYPSAAPGSQLTDNGIALTPTPNPAGNTSPTYIGIWDGPSQEFVDWEDYQNLTIPFTVTPAAAAPEPRTVSLLVTMLTGVGCLAGILRKKLA
jgi:hypothetical protein